MQESNPRSTGRSRLLVLVAAAALIVAGTVGTSVAAKLITSADIKNGTIKSEDVKKGGVQSSDVKDKSLTSADVKDGTLKSDDLKDGSVTADKLAPDAVAFPNSLWGTVLRNQSGAAETQLVAGPEGPPLGSGSLRLFAAGTDDVAAYGNSLDFALLQLADITSLSYATYNGDAAPAVRPSLRIEIDPHLVADTDPGGAFEFTTLVHQPPAGATGWEPNDDALTDEAWYLTGDEATSTGCTQDSPCTYTEIVSTLETNPDTDAAPPAVSTGVYFGLGSGVAAPTETAVDALVVNDFQFDFERMGVFLSPATD